SLSGDLFANLRIDEKPAAEEADRTIGDLDRDDHAGRLVHPGEWICTAAPVVSLLSTLARRLAYKLRFLRACFRGKSLAHQLADVVLADSESNRDSADERVL